MARPVVHSTRINAKPATVPTTTTVEPTAKPAAPAPGKAHRTQLARVYASMHAAAKCVGKGQAVSIKWNAGLDAVKELHDAQRVCAQGLAQAISALDKLTAVGYSPARARATSENPADRWVEGLRVWLVPRIYQRYLQHYTAAQLDDLHVGGVQASGRVRVLVTDKHGQVELLDTLAHTLISQEEPDYTATEE